MTSLLEWPSCMLSHRKILSWGGRRETDLDKFLFILLFPKEILIIMIAVITIMINP